MDAAYELVCDAFDGITAWHFTEGWGNLFTVTVASIAIVTSVIINRITLQRGAAQFQQGRLDQLNQFEQGRLDQRNDKLQAEVIALIDALSERSSQAAIVILRIGELEQTDLETMQKKINAIFSEDLWASYRRAVAHAFAVLMLTDDGETSQRIGVILEALQRQRRMFETAANPMMTSTVDGADADQLSHRIDAAAEQLKSYAVRKFGVPAYDQQGQLLNKRNLLPPA